MSIISILPPGLRFLLMRIRLLLKRKEEDGILVAFAEELGPIEDGACEKASKDKVKLVGVLPWLL
jgi:hypothetical protein